MRNERSCSMQDDYSLAPFSTSVETALNSRCSSDHHDDQMTGHWGVYDPDTRLPVHYRKAIERATLIPRFTYSTLDVNFHQRPIVCAVSSDATGVDQQWLHIESGMQQQAIHLACAALGVGTCIYNLGVDGQFLYADLWGTVNMGLEMMKPSYGGSLWSTDPPPDWRPDSSLSEPRRIGDMPLLAAMEKLSAGVEGRSAASEDYSQLLWAARGCTPHICMGHVCGLTIPTWAARQDYASVYLVSQGGAFLYVNDDNGVPTHAINRIGDSPVSHENETCIVLASNEDHARSLWEIGYMLENLMLEAVSLGIGYHVELVDRTQRSIYESCGIRDVCALFYV